MERYCIFHIPNHLDSSRASASQIRPLKMIEAFRNIGYEVDIVQGYGTERKQAIKKIKDKIKNGVIYDFLYAESSTMPTLLTEKNHLPTHPFLDYSFFSFVRKHGIKIGLFYRDIYWKFDEYRQNVKGLYYLVAIFMYRYDLKMYKKMVNKLYLPTESMYKYLKSEIPSYIVDVLPPGCERRIIEKKSNKHITLLYVGGIGNQYRIHKILEVVSKMKSVTFLLCCRKSEWEKEKKEYEQYLSDNIEIYHKSGEELEALYKRADIGMVYFEPDLYREFAMPYKIFEYLGHGIPMIASSHTAVGEFVKNERIGWTIDYNAAELEKLLLNLRNALDEILQKSKNCEEAIHRHTWEERARKVQEELSK